MSYAQYPGFQHYQQRWNTDTTDLRTLIITLLLGAIIGAYVLIKTFTFLGFPVWLRIRQLVTMSMDVLSLRRPSFGQTSDADSSDDDTMQRGGMLGSLFNMSPGTLLQKGVRGVASAFSTGSSNVPPGLGNISNSCYQNSVIQGLASLPSLRDYLSKTTSQHPSLSPESTNGALFEIISKLNDPENKGSHFWIRGKLKSMSTFEQQDAQEYYSKVLDELDKEIKKTSSSKRRSSVSWLEVTKSLSDSSNVGDGIREKAKDGTTASLDSSRTAPNPLEGQLAQRVGCTSCGYSEGLTLIPFNCITVSLGRNYGYDIRECLDEYTNLEFIDGVECAKCTLLKLEKTLAPLVNNKPESPLKARLDAVQEALEKEDFEDKTLLKTLNVPKKNWVQSTKSKQAVVARAPQSLVLHVNRSSFNEMTGMPYKNSAAVSYPTVLDLGNWCLGSTSNEAQDSDASKEQWPRDPRESMLSAGEPVDDSPFRYRLRAAVTHYGSHGYGHYVCYRSHPLVISEKSKTLAEPPMEEDDEDLPSIPTQEHHQVIQREQWWRFSDDSVHAVSEQEAHQGNVFMLFYERIDDTVPPTPTAVDATTEVKLVPELAPLPPADFAALKPVVEDDEAAAVALPEDDDLLDLIPPDELPVVQPANSEPSPDLSSAQSRNAPLLTTDASSSPSHEIETEVSEAESEDAPSTQLTSDYESEADVPTPPKSKPVPKISPDMMRTAGNKTSRGQGNRQSLPLVSAT